MADAEAYVQAYHQDEAIRLAYDRVSAMVRGTGGKGRRDAPAGGPQPPPGWTPDAGP